MKKSKSQPVNNLIHGRRSKFVQEFLKKHGIDKIELPSTGSYSQDMILKLGAYQEKMDAMKVAMDVLRSRDSRALSMFSQLIEINMMLAKFEKESQEKGIELLNHQPYLKWQLLKFEILKHYDKIKFDLTKLQAETVMNSKTEEDVLYLSE
jgi:hypothetical protein